MECGVFKASSDNRVKNCLRKRGEEGEKREEKRERDTKHTHRYMHRHTDTHTHTLFRMVLEKAF